MGMTIAEKIIAAAAGVESVKPGDGNHGRTETDQCNRFNTAGRGTKTGDSDTGHHRGWRSMCSGR